MGITKKAFGFDYGRQIICDRRKTKSITFVNHLERSPLANWCQMHAKGDEDKEGFKHYSRIRLVAQDYSAGTGNNSFYCYYNFEPVEIKNLKNIADQRWNEYSREYFKITNRQTSEFMQVKIARTPTFYNIKTGKTEELKNPWSIEVSNGLAKAEYKPDGSLKNGYPIDDTAKTIKLRFTEADFWNMITTVSDFINLWEQAVIVPHINRGIYYTEPLIQADKEAKAAKYEVS